MRSPVIQSPPNNGRQFEVDLAKVLAIATMVLVHMFEWLLPYVEVFPNWLTLIIEFAGGPLSGPLFMTAMGIGLVYSKRQNPQYLAQRGLWLFGQGYLLNFLRAGLLCGLLYFLRGEAEYLTLAQDWMLVSDILQFAGLAFLLFALLKRLDAKPIPIAVLSILMLGMATLIKPVQTDSRLIQVVLGFFFYQYEYSFFPLFSWFIFPVAGYCFAIFLQRSPNKARFYNKIFFGSTLLFILYTALLTFFGYDVLNIFMGDEYYRQDIITAPWILLINGIMYAVLFYLSLRLKSPGIRGLVRYVSSKVNAVYIAQWILIMWLYMLVLSRFSFTVPAFFLLTAGVLALSIALVYAWDRLVTRSKPTRS